MSVYTEKVKDSTLLLLDGPAATPGHDLSTANGASMLAEFKKVVDVETAQVWVNKYGFPWAADRVYCYEFTEDYGVLAEDMIERAASLSLLSRLVSIAKGSGRITHKDVLAWPVASSPLAGGHNLLLYCTWEDVSAGMKAAGRANSKEMYYGRQSSAQDLAVAFVPDTRNWRGHLLPPFFKPEAESIEEAVLSGVDFVPLFVGSTFGAQGFEAVVRYAACTLVSELLPRLIRGIVPTVVCKVSPKGDVNIAPSRNFPTPTAVMGYELYKSLSKQTDLLSCPRCGDWFVPRRKDQQSCGKDACSKWIQRRKE